VINDEKGVAARELQACGLAELALFFGRLPRSCNIGCSRLRCRWRPGREPGAVQWLRCTRGSWLPAARGMGHRGALVLVTNIGTFDRRADSYGGFGGGHPHFHRHDGRPWSVVFRYTPSNTPLALRRDRGP
jgi:hypothetical protein